MRVLVISRHYYRPGEMTGGHIHQQCAELRRMGVDVQVVCPVPRFNVGATKPGKVRKLFASAKSVMLDDVPVTYVPYWNVPHRLSPDLDCASLRRSVLRAIAGKVRRAPFDVVHAHRLFPDGCAALPIARRLGVPFVTTARGSDVYTHPQRNPAVARLTRQLIRESDRVSAVSQALADQMVALERPRHEAAVLRNGVDTDRFKPAADPLALRRKLGLPLTGVGVCSVCRLVVEKGPRELLEAFTALLAQGHDAWLLLVGDGPVRPELEEWCRRRGLEPRVFFAGARDNSELPDWLNAADIFTLASYQEGLPNVVLEAMASGLPVVATDVGGTSEAVDDDCAFLIPARDVSALREAVGRILDSAELRARMGQAARRRIEEHFSWRRSALDAANLYDAAIAERRQRMEMNVRPATRAKVEHARSEARAID